MAVLGHKHKDFQSPYGWFISDFYLLYHLLRAYGRLRRKTDDKKRLAKNKTHRAIRNRRATAKTQD
ncbi:hypothetical protein V8E54_005453 [Elaphomyces granulatus]